MKRPAIIASIITALPVMCIADYDGPMWFSIYTPCLGTGSYCGDKILARGEIQEDTQSTFKKFIDTYKKGGDTPPNTISFDSGGGNLAGAIAFGKMIREMGFNTHLASEYWHETTKSYKLITEHPICASACVFAFAGGINREIEENSKLGVHQFYSNDQSLGDSSTQIAIVFLAQYLEDMGVSRTIMDLASLTLPEKIYWLNSEQMRLSRIENMTAFNSDWMLDSTPDGTIYAKTSQIRPITHSTITLIISKIQNEILIVIIFIPQDASYQSLSNHKDILQDQPITITVDGGHIYSLKSGSWIVANKELRTMLSIPIQAASAISKGKLLELDIPVPNVYREYSPSAQFTLNNLSRIMPAILK